MGSFFAPRLAATLGGSGFRVLADGERKERLENRGVLLNGVPYRFPVVTPQDAGDPADLVLIAVKHPALAQAVADIRNQVGPETQILCVLNGVDSEERAAAAYGWDHVLYSYMRVSIVMRDGAANYDPAAGSVHFGEAKNESEAPTARVRAVGELFDACGIPYRVDADMIRGIWFKFMCNVGENLTCALLGVPFGAFRKSGHANAIRRAAMREVVEIANRRGIDLGQEDIDRQEKTLRGLPFTNKPSTLQDLEQKRPTEIAMFAGKVLELGRELGVETPVNWMLYQSIRALEEKNRGLFDE